MYIGLQEAMLMKSEFLDDAFDRFKKLILICSPLIFIFFEIRIMKHFIYTVKSSKFSPELNIIL